MKKIFWLTFILGTIFSTVFANETQTADFRKAAIKIINDADSVFVESIGFSGKRVRVEILDKAWSAAIANEIAQANLVSTASTYSAVFPKLLFYKNKVEYLSLAVDGEDRLRSSGGGTTSDFMIDLRSAQELSKLILSKASPK